MSRGVKEGSATAVYVEWMVNQVGCHDTRNVDNHRDLCEIMGTIDTIKDEMHKLVNMNQWSHCQDSSVRDHPMEETSVVQPVLEPDEK